jgi:hypothetical protein
MPEAGDTYSQGYDDGLSLALRVFVKLFKSKDSKFREIVTEITAHMSPPMRTQSRQFYL